MSNPPITNMGLLWILSALLERENGEIKISRKELADASMKDIETTWNVEGDYYIIRQKDKK